jgi:hypothetical protein
MEHAHQFSGRFPPLKIFTLKQGVHQLMNYYVNINCRSRKH